MKDQDKKQDKITILFEGWDSGLGPGDFFDPVDLFKQIIDDGVEAGNLTIYSWNPNHLWHDSYGESWLDLVREYQDRKCYIVSDLGNTFDYGLVWGTE